MMTRPIARNLGFARVIYYIARENLRSSCAMRLAARLYVDVAS